LTEEQKTEDLIKYENLPTGRIYVIMTPGTTDYTVSLFHTLTDEQKKNEEIESLMVIAHGMMDLITKETEKLYFRGATWITTNGKNLVEPETSTEPEDDAVVDPKKLN